MKTTIAREQGFTLVEMAMVLVIVGLLLGGGLTVLSTQIEQQKVKGTERQLDEIKEALIGFAIANGRLPCPAPATSATGAATAGLEPTPLPNGCTNESGVLPWATLGFNEADAWGNRFTYRVAKEFTRTVPQVAFASCAAAPPANPQFSAFALCSRGDMTVLDTAGGAMLASAVPAMVISHGKNGNGAFNTGGIRLAVDVDADELDNQLDSAAGTATANTVFISKTPTDTFDDHITWLSPNILFNRMVQAGKLP